MKNWFNSLWGVMFILAVALLAIELLFTLYFEEVLTSIFSLSGIGAEIFLVALEVAFMTPLIYLAIFRRLKNSAKKLEESSGYTRSLIEASLDPLVTISPAGIITDVNKETELSTGISRKDLIGTDFADYFTDPEKARDGYKKVFSEGAVTDYPLTLRNKNGSTMDVLYNASVYRDQSGNVVGVFAAARDITEQKKSAREIALKSRDLLEAQRMAHLGSWQLDVKTNHVTWSDELYRMYEMDPGLPPPDYTEHSKLFTKESFGILSTALALTQKEGIPYELELETIKKNGSHGWMRVKGEAARDALGNIFELHGIALDITEQKQAEIEIRQSEEKYRTLIEKIEAAVVVHKPDTSIVTSNATAQRLLGLTEEEMLGKAAVDPDWNFYREDRSSLPVEEYPVNQIIAKKSALSNLIIGVHRPREKNDVWVLVNGDPVFDEQGKISQVIVTFADITKQKEAQEELLRSERGLAEAQRMAHLGSWELDLVNNVLSWSEENYRIFGFEHEKFDATYEAFLETIHPDDREFVNKAYTESVKSHTPYNIEHRLLLKDGSIKYVNERCETFYDDDGKPLRSIGTTYDISNLKKAEEKIKELSNLYATLSLCNQAIVHSNNKEELFARVCRAAVDSGGFKMAWIGLIDKENKKIVPTFSYNDTTDYLKEIHVSVEETSKFGLGPTGTAVRESRAYWCQDFEHDPNTKAWREAGTRAGWKSSAALPIYQKGVIIGAITLYKQVLSGFDEQAQNLLLEMATDVSYALDNFIDKAIKTEVEDNLAKGKAKDEAIMASIGEGMIAVDKAGKVLTMNPSAEKITGRSASDTIGTALVETIPAVYEDGGPVPQEKRPLSVVLNKEVLSASDTFYFTHKDGDRIPVTLTATPVFLNNEKIGAVVVFRDITQEKEIEKTRGDLLSLASHQLRTPLSGTKWLIETLKKGIQGPLTDNQEEYLDELYKINERMTILVQDMLGVLRMEGGAISVKTTKVSSSGIIKTVLESFTPVANGKLIPLESDEAADFVIETDPTLLQNILDSLISNAITYSSAGKTVLIGTKKIDNEIIFSVKDSGIGIPKKEQGPHLFERFYRASNAKTFNTKGTGLGLYIAATLAKKIGATITYESEEGKGSTFLVHVPYSENGVLPELPPRV